VKSDTVTAPKLRDLAAPQAGTSDASAALRVPRLSIASPAYNEAEGIAATVTHWVQYLEEARIARSYEIVICNDGSKDDTGLRLQELASRYPILKVVHHEVNRGAAAAVRTAISNTTGDWVLLLDSDGQFPVENLEQMWKAAVAWDADAVIGCREQKEDTAFARFGSWSSTLVCGFIYKRRLRDSSSALQLVRGSLLRSLDLESRGLNSSTEITGRLLEMEDCVRVFEVQARHLPRSTGRSSRTFFRDSWHRFLFVMYLAMRRFLLKRRVLEVPHELAAQRRKPQ
jgi:dolichol-phosphate mannosyltransferase